MFTRKKNCSGAGADVAKILCNGYLSQKKRWTHRADICKTQADFSRGSTGQSNVVCRPNAFVFIWFDMTCVSVLWLQIQHEPSVPILGTSSCHPCLSGQLHLLVSMLSWYIELGAGCCMPLFAGIRMLAVWGQVPTPNTYCALISHLSGKQVYERCITPYFPVLEREIIEEIDIWW